MKKRGLSIRYKILGLLTMIPLFMLTAYLLMAVRIFEQDKIAYVFDSSSNVSATMAAQIKNQLNSVLTSMRPIFQDYLTTRNFSSLSKSVFENEFSIDALIVFNQEPTGQFKAVTQLEKGEKVGQDVMAALGPQLQNYLSQTYHEGRLVRAPFGDDRVALFEKVSNEQKTRVTIFLTVIRLSEVSETFRSGSTAQKMYLIGQDGIVLFGPDQSAGKYITQTMNLSFLKGTSAKIAQGAETSVAPDGSEQLVSFSRAGIGDLYVVSTVSKAKALGAVQILIRKSLIFFGILIGLTAIISLFASNTLTSALTALFQATQKVSEGDFDIRVQVNSSDEVGSLADNFNIMASEVSRLMAQTAEKARMESELQTAKTVQETLFPDTEARIGPLEIAGYYEPASECGGDWWHYCKVGQKIFLWIGDATGHGAPAALITSAAKSASTIIERLNISPAKALELLNRSIYDVSKGRIMMTFFLASFDPATGELTYCNASHEAPFLFRHGDDVLKKRDLVPLNEVNNPRLGQARDSVYQQTSVKLEKGDAVFFYTDGIPDIQNPDREAWGEREFLKNLVAANKDYPNVRDSVERFARSFQEHRQGAPLIDDVTFFVVKNESTT